MKRLKRLIMLGFCLTFFDTPTHCLELKDLLGLGALFLKDEVAEKILGEVGRAAFEDEYHLSGDAQSNARVSNVGNRLAQFASRKDIQYQFKVTLNHEVNACAIPGGHIYVNQGLLDCPGLSDDELAFVLAHEITHIEKKHGLKQMRKALPLSLAVGEIDSESAKEIASIVLNIYRAGRSRKDEEEADIKGFELLVKAGYDPSAGLSFMRRLETLSKDNPDPFELLFATHPPTHDRAEALKDAYIVAVTGSDYKTSEEENNDFVLSVDFLDQFSWGGSKHNLNCGPASLVMAACYAKGEKPSGEKIGQVNQFLGIPPQGAYTDCPQLVRAAKSVFGLKAIPTSWTIEQIKQEVAKKKSPVIAGVTSEYLSNRGYPWKNGHFVVVVGFSKDYLICHDPGTRKGKNKKYNVEEFKKAFGAQKNAVIYGFGKINNPPPPQQPPTEPQPKTPNPPPVRRDKILLEEGPQHLGDDQKTRMIYTKEFTLFQEDLSNRKEAAVQIKVKGIPKKDPIIYFNRREVGRAVTQTGIWEEFTFSFNPGILRVGKNLLDIETFIPEFWNSYDDCEFKDVVLLLRDD